VGPLRTAFNDLAWTLYPTTEVLLHLIGIEEAQLLRRERVVGAGGEDPGRPSYANSYGELAWPISYTAIFTNFAPSYDLTIVRPDESMYQTGLGGPLAGRHPLLPLIPSLLHPNIVIYARTHVLMAGIARTSGAIVSRPIVLDAQLISARRCSSSEATSRSFGLRIRLPFARWSVRTPLLWAFPPALTPVCPTSRPLFLPEMRRCAHGQLST
jgi:hypothetical protein